VGRGSAIERAFRVRVYAGSDPLTGKRHDLTEVVPPGPRAAAEAEKVRARLLNQVDEQRNPRTKATVNQLLDRYLAVVELEESTRKAYVGYLDVHVRPMLGVLPLSKPNDEVLDTFYAELRRCRVHCDRRRKGVDHRTKPSTYATSVAGRTSAVCWPRRPCVRSTGFSRVRWSGRCGGAGLLSVRRAARSRPLRRRLGRVSEVIRARRGRGQDDPAAVGQGVLVIAGGQSPPLLEDVEAAFDDVAAGVLERVVAHGPAAARPGRPTAVVLGDDCDDGGPDGRLSRQSDFGAGGGGAGMLLVGGLSFVENFTMPRNRTFRACR
jgi:hypothetical protein